MFLQLTDLIEDIKEIWNFPIVIEHYNLEFLMLVIKGIFWISN